MTDPGKMWIGQLVASMRPAHLWAVLGAIAAIAGGAFYLGELKEQTSSQAELNKKDQKLAVLQSNLSTQTEKTAGVEASLKEAADLINAQRRHQKMLEMKAEFLNRYVSYYSARGTQATKLFADFVCVLWRNAQENRLSMDLGGMEIKPDRIGRQMLPQLLQILANMGFDPNEIMDLPPPRVSRNPNAPPNRTVQEAALAERAAASLAKAQLTKTITFFDGTAYRLPDRVAMEVHLREDCAPR